ncbi:hypothetical protein Ancab_020600 [Ancistrocladus abbreviatus]
MSKGASVTAFAATHELKQRVFACLDRLSDRATLSQANAELESIARTLPPDSLSSFLSCCLSVDSNHKSPVRSHSMKVLSLLAITHKNSLSPHLHKILSSLTRRLRDSDSSVRSACVDAISSLSCHLTSSPFKTFLDPLLSALLIEQDYNVQIGSALCLAAAIESSPNVEPAELKKAVPKLVKLAKAESFKAKPALLGLMGSVVDVNGGAVVRGSKGLMGSVVACVVEMLSSEDWATRKAAAEVLEKVAVTAERDFAAEWKKFCVDSLEGRRFDKVKVARETMNRALECWKVVPSSSTTSDEEPSLCRSISSISKDATSGGCSSSVSKSSHNFSFETPQPNKTVSKSMSSFSDESTITFSPPSSKSSPSVDSETPHSKKTMSKSRSSLLDGSRRVAKRTPVKNTDTNLSIPLSRNPDRKPSDWKIEIAVTRTPSLKVPPHDGMEFASSVENDNSSYSVLETAHSFSRMCVERLPKFGCLRSATPVIPFPEGDDSDGVVVDSSPIEEVIDNNAEFEGLSLIREQLVQIERQQANLLDLLQSFMGTSQSGISSLETRVSGLERALDEISYDLAVQSGRFPNDSVGNTCCMLPGAEFLSPKFWRRAEGRCSAPKSCCSGSMPNRDSGAETIEMSDDRLQQQIEGMKQLLDVVRDSPRNADLNFVKSAKSVSQNAQRMRACTASSIDGTSPRTSMTPAVHGS